MGQYTKIRSPFAGPGTYTNPGMVALIKTYCAIKGIPWARFWLTQGSFNTTVAASAGTHDEADCIDTLDSVDEALFKRIGGNAQQRTRAQGFVPHTHMVRMFSTAMAWLAEAQDEAYRKYQSNGLGNLSHKDTSWCPRYRGVKHLAGPSTKQYVATKETWGYSQAGCHADKDADLRKTTRAKGWVLGNIAGKVHANGSDYWVTTSGTFYNTANFTTYTPPPEGTMYYVRAAAVTGHASTSAASAVVGGVKVWGTALKVLRTKTVNGARWGWVDPSDGAGRWYLLAHLSQTKPTTRVGRVGDLRVGEYNVAAQASGHAGTYPKRAPLSAARMVAAGADVIGVVEYGSGSTRHADGRTFLEISDEARQTASGGNLLRVAHGEKWRHILRRKDTTTYHPNSGASTTLHTRVDDDGTQVVAAATVHKATNIRTGLVCFHFDVNSTPAQLKAQAVETLVWGEAWRREQGIQPWNITYVGDHNDIGSTVRAVFATWGFLPAARGEVAGKYRTTNSWEPVLTVGPRRDDIFVPEGAAEDWTQWLDAVAADHNYNQAVRAVYGNV